MNITEQQFLEYLKYERNYSDNTIASYKQDLDCFHNFLFDEERDYLNLTEHDIRDFETNRVMNGDSKRSLARRICGLRHYYKFMFKRGYVKSNPFLTIESIKKEIKYPEALTFSQVDELFKRNSERKDKLASRDQALLELLYSSGMRCSEIVNLKTVDIDFGGRTIRVLKEKKKGSFLLVK